ncbi:MAG: signal recognition particle-docking protein FtsY [Proteobacteria bacterium]|nr:signal recognition particle-docking protein FtsY [Pseudomonadota bacterium]
MSPIVIGIIVAVVVLGGVAALVLKGGSSKNWDSVEGGASAELLPSPSAAKPAAKAAPKAEPAPASGLFSRLVDGLARTKGRMIGGLDELFGGKKIDEDLWQKLEELLITSDVGVRTATSLLDEMKAAAAKEELEDPARLRQILADRVRELLVANAGSMAQPESGPLIIMVVGVNGAGKTTTIGKLASRHVTAGRKVVIAAGDTFRAAAIDQVVVWGKRSGAEVVRHEEGSDPAAVAHDAVTAGVARGADVVICDTAGRLHSQTDLMRELQKVHRVIGKVHDGAPHEVLLVLDSTNGQNAIAQAREFSNAVGVTGIALTKLDGTARGGVILGIADELDIPVKLIGIGEGVDDLRDFEPEAFVDALFSAGDVGRGQNSADAAALDAEAGIA